MEKAPLSYDVANHFVCVCHHAGKGLPHGRVGKLWVHVLVQLVDLERRVALLERHVCSQQPRQSRQRPKPTVAGLTEEEGLGRTLLLLDVGHRRVTHQIPGVDACLLYTSPSPRDRG